LKRFRFSRTYREKLSSLVRFPLEGLDLRDFEAYPTDASDPAIYDLVAISVCCCTSIPVVVGVGAY
jgi:hypothetical protein